MTNNPPLPTNSAETPPEPNLEKRLLLGGAVALGAGFAAALTPQQALAQAVENGIPANSVLAKVGRGSALQVGFAQTPLWFYRDPKTGRLHGVYKDLVDILAGELRVKVAWHEVSFGNLTLGLRKGDFDLFGSSAVYTVPRALVADYIGPLWSKGELVIVRKDNAAKYVTIADLNQPGVIFSVAAGSSEQDTMPKLFPKAKFIAVAGPIALGAEPVRTGRATAFVVGDSDALAFAKKNASWAHVVDPSHPFGKRPNTWMIRYGDAAWTNFLNMWAQFVTVHGTVKQLYDKYLTMLT
ncbi:MAG: transporter substrate-binding domain-containing protein [Rhodospirillales bacterium]|nr:transporter substrate-binding domain-containing protein [Rhodospirillales bacterium]